MSLSTERHSLRQRILAARDTLRPEDRRRRSAAIGARLRALEPFTQAGTVFLYAAFRSEVETLPLLAGCLQAGQRVAVPWTRPEPPGLVPYLISDPARDLRPGYCDIPEPDPEQTLRLEPREIEVVLLPGAVFDLQGGRLGYGGGFYDRFLVADAPQAVRIGLGFELQVVDTVPLLDHDQRLDWLVTETRTLRLPARQHAGAEG